jgi:hypothetical protein
MDALPTGDAKGPYPGLRPFRADEWSIFCGREALVSKLVGRLEQHNLLLLHGGSGSGKSSVVMAGVLPMLQREHRRAGEAFEHAAIRPSEGPFSALAEVLAKHLGAPDGVVDQTDYWAACLMANAPVVPLIDERIVARGLQSFCLVVDQFEEVFAWARDRRRSDVELLTRFLGEVSEADSEHFFVLVTMRSDFLGACAQFASMVGIINAHQYYMPNLDEVGIAKAITEPAVMFGGQVDPLLVRTLMLGAATSPDPLPLLQHALMRMAEGKSGANKMAWTLDESDLRRVSEGANPLSVHADKIWDALAARHGAPGRDAMEWIFRALFDVEKSGEAVRRPRDFGDLKHIVGGTSDARAAMVEDIVETFAAERNNLLVVSGKRGRDSRRVDISHEALLRQWTRIAGGGAVKVADSLKQKEIEDGLMWRSLAFPKRAKDWLSPGVLIEARKLFQRMDAAPERARRYLSDGSCPDVRLSADWKNIRHLIRRSTVLQAALWTGSALLVIGVVVGTWIWRAKAESKSVAVAAQSARALAVTDEQSTQLRALVAGEANAVLRVQGDETSVQNATLGSERIQSLGLAAQLDSVAATAQDSSAYMWIGDAKTMILYTPQGEDVPYDKVVAGQTYKVSYNIALRADMPREKNRSAPRTGVVRKGGGVVALAAPERSAESGQYWLRVRPVVVATVYIQVAAGSRKVDDLTDALRGEGYTVPPVQTIAAAAGARDIRYCNDSDKAVADRLSATVQTSIGGAPIRTFSLNGRAACSLSRPGVVELWLGKL